MAVLVFTLLSDLGGNNWTSDYTDHRIQLAVYLVTTTPHSRNAGSGQVSLCHCFLQGHFEITLF